MLLLWKLKGEMLLRENNWKVWICREVSKANKKFKLCKNNSCTQYENQYFTLNHLMLKSLKTILTIGNLRFNLLYILRTAEKSVGTFNLLYILYILWSAEKFAVTFYGKVCWNILWKSLLEQGITRFPFI